MDGDDLCCIACLAGLGYMLFSGGDRNDRNGRNAQPRPYNPNGCTHCSHGGCGPQPCPYPAGPGAPYGGHYGQSVNGQGMPYAGGPMPQYGGPPQGGIVYVQDASAVPQGYPVDQGVAAYPQGSLNQPPMGYPNAAPPPQYVVAQPPHGYPTVGNKV